MSVTHLHRHHRRLRARLEMAYAAPHWDAAKINRIADRLVSIERSLAALRSRHHAGSVERNAR